jgi:hypothetical protein
MTEDLPRTIMSGRSISRTAGNARAQAAAAARGYADR